MAGAVKYINYMTAEEYDPPYLECSGYDTKQSDCEALIMHEIWEIRNTLSLPLLPGPFWSGVLAPDRVMSFGQIQRFDI